MEDARSLAELASGHFAEERPGQMQIICVGIFTSVPPNSLKNEAVSSAYI